MAPQVIGASPPKCRFILPPCPHTAGARLKETCAARSAVTTSQHKQRRDGAPPRKPPRSVYDTRRSKRRRPRWLRIVLWTSGSLVAVFLIAALVVGWWVHGLVDKGRQHIVGCQEEPGRAPRPSHQRPADGRAGDRLRPPLWRRQGGAIALGHADAGADRSPHQVHLAALAAARPVRRDPRIRPGQDQRRLFRRWLQAGDADGRERHPGQRQLPDHRRLQRLRATGGRVRRRLRARRPVLPSRQRGRRRPVLADRHRARLPEAQRPQRPGLLALPPHRLRLLPKRTPAGVPEGVRAACVEPTARHRARPAEHLQARRRGDRQAACR